MLSNDSSARTRCICNCSYRSVEAITWQIGPVVRTSITSGGSGEPLACPQVLRSGVASVADGTRETVTALSLPRSIVGPG